MSLFELKNNIVVIEPQGIMVPEMKVIWDSDKSKDKSKAYKELSYIYFVADFKSPYANYPEDKRKEIVRDDFIRDSKWKEPDYIIAALKKYSELQETSSMRMLIAAKIAQDMITDYFKTGKCKIDPRELMGVLSNIGKSVESLDKIEEKVKKEISSNEKIRGGGKISSRER